MRKWDGEGLALRAGSIRRVDGDDLQPWRIAVVALVAAVHAGVLVHLSRPAPHAPSLERMLAIDRIELVEISAPPPPPILVRPPLRTASRSPSPRAAPPVYRAQPSATFPVEGRRDSEETIVGRDPEPFGSDSGGGESTFARPSRSGRPLRAPERPRLPGREEAFVEGFHVREAPSIEDRVVGVAAMVFGGGRPETCDDVRQRLIGATPGRARDMDVERLRRLCTD